jgi:hypothetical protein
VVSSEASSWLTGGIFSLYLHMVSPMPIFILISSYKDSSHICDYGPSILLHLVLISFFNASSLNIVSFLGAAG